MARRENLSEPLRLRLAASRRNLHLKGSTDTEGGRRGLSGSCTWRLALGLHAGMYGGARTGSGANGGSGSGAGFGAGARIGSTEANGGQWGLRRWNGWQSLNRSGRGRQLWRDFRVG